MNICQIPYQQAPMSLLLEADPNEEKVVSYLPNSLCYGAFVESECVAICALLPLRDDIFELINIAVAPNTQAKGIGSRLLNHVIEAMKDKKTQKIVLGTGTFGYQLAFYQKAGFRVHSIDKDFFLKNYPEPVFENGIQHQDMLRLELKLT